MSDSGLVEREFGPLALGTWTFAGDAIWGDSDKAECVRVVHAAIDRGISLFDTAPNYGNGRSEEILGEALKSRTDVTVATKMKVDGLNRIAVKASVHESMSRLQRDRIDVMQIHWPPNEPADLTEALEAFDELRRSGEIRSIGVCNFGPYDLDDAQSTPLISNQVPYSLLWRAIEYETAVASGERGLATIAYSPLQQGLLGGRYRSLDEYPSGRKRTRLFTDSPNRSADHPTVDQILENTLAELYRLARTWGLALLDLALGFVRSCRDIDTALVGARTVPQLERVHRAATVELSAEQIAELESATSALKDRLGPSIDMFRTPSRVRFTGASGNPER